MPFNSAQNNFNSSYSPEESFKILQNTYAIPKDGQPYLPYAQLVQRPQNTDTHISPMNLHSNFIYYNQDELQYINNHQRKHGELVGEGVGRISDNEIGIHRPKRPTMPKPPMPKPPRAPRRRKKADDEEMEGGNIFKKAAKSIKKSAKSTGKSIDKSAKSTGKAIKKSAIKSGDAIKKSATDEDGMIRYLTSRTLDEAPVLLQKGTELGVTAYTGNPAAGKAAGMVVKYGADKGRKKLEQKTGYGVGKYSKNINLDKIIDKYIPDYKTGAKPSKPSAPSASSARKMSKGMTDRNKIVKQVMAEKGLSLPQASKYVKENKLY